MKNFNKLFVGLILAFGLMALLSPSGMATNAARIAKSDFVTPFSLACSSVTSFTVLESSSGLKKPGAVYQVTLSSGAASEFVLLVDSSACQGLTATLTTGITQVGPRLLYNSTTASTVYTFDPPINFYNGLMEIDSAVTGQAAITWEEGRTVGGN